MNVLKNCLYTACLFKIWIKLDRINVDEKKKIKANLSIFLFYTLNRVMKSDAHVRNIVLGQLVFF